MPSSKPVCPAPEAVAAPIRGVGRLVPLTGITVRPHPDRVMLHRFLQELRLPLATIDSFLDLLLVQELPAPAQQALSSILENTRYLGQLVGDYAHFSRLEGDQVKPCPSRTSPLGWLEAILAPHTASAAELGLELAVVHRSFLPSVADFDAELASEALGAVLRTAMHRALPGEMQVRVSYQSGGGVGSEQPARLHFEVATQGGGFRELDQGYVFEAFHATDAAQRPMLGLSVAQRLALLLGGELTIDSPGARSCSYRLSFLAPPAAGACWIDPMLGPDHSLGLIFPGLVLFAEVGNDNQLLCASPLRRAGYGVEFVASLSALRARLGELRTELVSVVVDASLPGLDLSTLARELRELGCRGSILLLAGAPLQHEPVGCEAVLMAPIVASELVQRLQQRAQSDNRNATRLR